MGSDPRPGPGEAAPDAAAPATPRLRRPAVRPAFLSHSGALGASRVWGTAAALALAALVVAGWFFEPCLDLLLVAPLIAAVGSGPAATAWIGAAAVLGAVLLGIPNRIFLSSGHWQDVVETALAGMFAVVIAFVRRRSERALRESERQFRAVFDEALDAMAIADDAGRYVYANPAACALFGRPHEELLGLRVHDVSPSSPDPAQAWRRFRQAERLRGEWAILRPDGTARQVEFSATAGVLPGRHLTILRDVTDRKEAEDAQRRSEERFRALVENSSDGTLLVNRLGRITYASPAAERILGLPAAEITGRGGMKLVQPEDREAIERVARGCLERPGALVRVELRAQGRGGTPRHLEAVAFNHLSNPAIEAVVVNFRDVTERDWMGQALRDSDRFNREVVSNAGEGILVFDQEMRCLVWNRFMEGLTGIMVEEVIGRPILELFPGLRKQGADELMARALGGETVASVDVSYRFRRSGKSGWVSNTYGPHRNAGGEIVGVIVIVRDISERKRSEEAVRENERRFRAVFEGAGDALLIFDDEARFVDANTAACELYGRSREEILGRRMEDLRTAAYDFETTWQEFLRSGQLRGEVRVLRPDGTVRDVEYMETAHFLPGRHLTIQRDVTERRRAERRVQVFSDLGLKLSSALTAAEAAKVIAGCADELWHFDACTVDLYSEDSDRVYPLLTVDTIGGQRVSVAPVLVNDPPSPRLRQVLADGARLILRAEPVSESDSIPFGDTARLSRSILVVPIRNGSSVIGFVSVQSYEPKAYDERDLDSLQSLADFCGGALVRIRVFEDLRRGERMLREAQAIGRIGVWERDLRDGSLIWSREMYEFFGLDPEHFRPSLEAMIERVLPEDRAAFEQLRRAGLQFHQEFRIRKEDGSVAVIQSRGEPVLDETGEPVRMIGVSHEVTEERRAEERLRKSYEELRALSARLGAVREEESARIARAVHDEVGQALTALKLDLSWLETRLGRIRRGKELDLLPKIAAMAGLLDTTLDAVQRISTELRPGVLHELGLEAAVGWYAREFQKRTEIACRLRSELAGAPVEDSRSTAVFRILQEILTNVARHAAATEVEISLGRDNGELVLDARDNGRGISEDRISDSRSLGLIGMRERARTFGGNIVIRGSSGEGTSVSVRIPL